MAAIGPTTAASSPPWARPRALLVCRPTPGASRTGPLTSTTPCSRRSSRARSPLTTTSASSPAPITSPSISSSNLTGSLLRRESFGFLSFSCLPRNSRAVCRPVRRGGARGGEGPASDEIHCRPAGGVSARVKNSGFSPGREKASAFSPFFVRVLHTLGRNALKSGDQTGIIKILAEPFRAPGSAVPRPAAADMQAQKQK